MTLPELKEMLDTLYDQYNRPDFIPEDPVSIPHLFTDKEDIEIAGFLTALISWGNRKGILKSADRLMALMDHAPSDFVRNAGLSDIARLDAFVHRTMNGTDIKGLIAGLKVLYSGNGGLRAALRPESDESDMFPAVQRLRNLLLPYLHLRSHKHLANPDAGASAKRIHMFLRWMVRADARGIDFGLWSDFSTRRLVLPLDIHTGTIAREIGILTRKQNDRRAVMEVTQALRLLDSVDPIRYDFALFGFGIDRRWKK